jgi:circadian clock protein KaiC
VVERQIADLRAALETEETEVETLIEQEEARETSIGSERTEMASIRGLRS